MSIWQRDLINEDIDPDDYENPGKDTEAYRCPICLEEWAVGGWFPPDYHFSDWNGGFADVFCVDYGEDTICEWCEVQGIRKQ